MNDGTTNDGSGFNELDGTEAVAQLAKKENSGKVEWRISHRGIGGTRQVLQAIIEGGVPVPAGIHLGYPVGHEFIAKFVASSTEVVFPFEVSWFNPVSGGGWSYRSNCH